MAERERKERHTSFAEMVEGADVFESEDALFFRLGCLRGHVIYHALHWLHDDDDKMTINTAIKR